MDVIKAVDNTHNYVTGCSYKKAFNKQTSYTKAQVNKEEGLEKALMNVKTTTGSENNPVNEKNRQETLSDVLAAVKLDPAVLEARVTFTANEEKVNVSSNSNKGFMENEEQVLGEPSTLSSEASFDRVLSMQKAALLSLTPEQLEFLLMYTDYLRTKRVAVNKELECAFCKKSGRSVSWYTGHGLRDGQGRVICPVLRAYRCPCCGATGDRAHTVKYCPENIDLM